MSPSSLIVHCGARLVTRDELAAVPVPPSTRTWFPVSHLDVLLAVQRALRDGGFVPTRESLALSRHDGRFFATLDLESELAPGVRLACGIRNSLDRSLPISFCAGSRVLVCDNLAFRSEVQASRRHTRFGHERYLEALGRAVAGLAAFREAEAGRIALMQDRLLAEVEAESLILRAYETGIVSPRLLPDVIAGWRVPAHEEFTPRTLWSLMNAFTGALAPRPGRCPQRFAALSLRLSGLLSGVLESDH